jgi:DNA-binding LytR/AlgR family response regulator
MHILLIEDERPAARQFARMLQSARPGYRILDTLDSIAGAVRWLRHFPPPDLIFMDIQIADGISLDIFSQVEVKSPVIFTTAFDHFAVQAFKVNAVDYLLKPVDPEELEQALRKAERQQTPAADLQALTRLLSPAAYKERFLVKSGQHLQFVEAQEIAFFRSADGLTQAYTFQGKKYFVEYTLDELEKLLDPKVCFRVNRAVLMRIQAILKVHPHLNGRFKLETNPPTPEELFVSRERAGDFKIWLGG